MDKRAPLDDEQYMRLALEQAALGESAGEGPVGAVLVSGDGQVLAAACNRPVSSHDPTAHAESLVLREAGARVGNYRLEGTTLYVTLEPCVMCAGAMVQSRIRRVVFGSRDLRFGGVRSKFQLADCDILNHRVEVSEGVLGGECVAMLQRFFAGKRSG